MPLGLARFEPESDRRRAVLMSWGMLIAESGPFVDLGSYFDQPAGYPEWLAHIASEIEAAPDDSVEQQTG